MTNDTKKIIFCVTVSVGIAGSAALYLYIKRKVRQNAEANEKASFAAGSVRVKMAKMPTNSIMDRPVRIQS